MVERRKVQDRCAVEEGSHRSHSQRAHPARSSGRGVFRGEHQRDSSTLFEIQSTRSELHLEV